MKYRPGIFARIAALAVLSAPYNFSCTPKQEPTPSEQLQEFHAKYVQDRTTYETRLENAHDSFSRACLDGVISKSEQEEIFAGLNDAKKAKIRFEDNLANKAAEKDPTQLAWAERDEAYLALLDKNLHGLDADPPEFQKRLGQDGCNVKVEGCWSDGEQEAADTAVDLIVTILNAAAD